MQEAGEPRATGGGVLCLPIRESGETFGVICLSGKKGAAAVNAQDRLLAEPLVRSLARLCRATSQRQAFARLAQLDPATGLLQGEAFKTALGRLLTRATPLAANVALVLLQPQTEGAAASPEALGEVGRALAARLTEGCIGGRLGPDRFAIAWARRRETGDGPQDARLTFMAQAGSLADLGLFGLSSAQLRLSLAVFPEDGRDPAAIVAAAEQGLHSD
jgi:GGDEF domain-containing protein